MSIKGAGFSASVPKNMQERISWPTKSGSEQTESALRGRHLAFEGSDLFGHAFSVCGCLLGQL